MKIQIVPADNGGYCYNKETEDLQVYLESAEFYENQTEMHKVLGNMIGNKLDDITSKSENAIRSFTLDIQISVENW